MKCTNKETAKRIKKGMIQIKEQRKEQMKKETNKQRY